MPTGLIFILTINFLLFGLSEILLI